MTARGWQSQEFICEFDRPGAIVTLKIVNDRGETVAGTTYSPPLPYGQAVSLDEYPPPYYVAFDPLRLEFGVDVQAGPRQDERGRSAASALA